MIKKLLNGEKHVMTKTKRRGKDPVTVTGVETTPRLWLDWLHNKLLEAKREGKKLEVRETGRKRT